MSLQALSDYTIYSKYAHYIPEKKRRESWDEITGRVFAMHERKYSQILAENQEFQEEFEFAKMMVKKKKVLGSQRALQFGGSWIEKANAKIFNCSYTYADRPRVFQEIEYLLLAGCGVGFSVQKHHVKKLPDISPLSGTEETFVIPDSIEGWADAIGIAVNAYFVFEDNQFYSKKMVFDYSEIRPEGALIAGQFKAPGHKGLKKSIESIKTVIEKRLASPSFSSDEFANKLRPIDVYDIIMFASNSVLSGGIRRSATISLFSDDDQDMMTAKTGNWYEENPQRSRSNNSVLLVRGDTTWEQFQDIISKTKEFGEPGFYFAHSKEHGCNPCFTKDTKILTDEGWRTFESLVGTQPVILQDSRVIGRLENDVETWDVMPRGENIAVQNKATAVGITGYNQDVYKLKLSCGREVKATANHHFATTKGMIELSKLEKGDEVLIPLPLPFVAWKRGISFCSGYTTTCDGDESANLDWIHYKDKDFKAGFITAVFQRNGCGTWNHTDRCYDVLVGNGYGASAKIQLVSQELGIHTTIVEDESNHYLRISGETNISNAITLGYIPKNTSVAVKGLSSATSVVQSVEYIGKEDVYCLQEDNRRTLIAEGMTARRCVEIGLYPQTEDGKSGVSFCNLCEINGKACTTPEDFYNACRAAAIIGTMQAGYTDFKYLTPETKQITEREALLGVSITGVMDNPAVLLDHEVQKKGAQVCKDVNANIAKIIGINKAARITCTKPAGSTSCVLQTASGIHPHHARRYLRRVQGNRIEFPLQHYKQVNPEAVEKSVWSASGEDEVISFACEVPKGAILKNDLSAVDLLTRVRDSQKNWVLNGENSELCVSKNIHHNISNTVTVRPNEWDAVAKFIYDNREFFTGVSLLSASGDLDYPQAPFATVLTPEEIVREYGDGSILASGLIVDGLRAFDDNLWDACSAVLGYTSIAELTEMPKEPVKPSRADYKTNKAFFNDLADYAIQLNLYYQAVYDYKQLHLKHDWLRRAKQFANKYFSDDLKQMTYCLKHVSLWHTWLKIKKTHKPVDWENVVEETETFVAADTLAAQACAGGACELK